MSKKFKVMFVFVNDRMRTFIPLNISYLSAALKEAGFSTCLFDTSFYVEQGRLSEEKKKEDAGIFKAVDYSSIGIGIKKGDLIDDFLRKIESEKPDLLAFSVYSQSKEQIFKMAEAVKKKYSQIPIILGGIHTNIEPKDVVNRPYIDYICLGEGEEALVELASNLEVGKGVEGVKNIGWKNNGTYVQNPLRPVQNLDKYPFPDWDLFASYHIYGPYRGKLHRMALVEFSRQCPYQCTFCGNTIQKGRYKESGINLIYRHKSPQRWISELKYMKENYEIEFINIVDGTFVAQRTDVMEKVASLFRKEIDLPFFCDSTVTCLNEKKTKLLKEMGCVCINIGLETADEEYRRKYMDRPSMTNKQIVDAFLMCRDAGLDTRSYNIIGYPFETREQIMKTIDMNRKCEVGSLSLSIFMPYEGTKLRELCIREKLIEPDVSISGDGTYPIVRNPYLSDEELMGLYNIFALYVFSPKEVWPIIEMAEAETPFARQLRKELSVLYF